MESRNDGGFYFIENVTIRMNKKHNSLRVQRSNPEKGYSFNMDILFLFFLDYFKFFYNYDFMC